MDDNESVGQRLSEDGVRLIRQPIRRERLPVQDGMTAGCWARYTEPMPHLSTVTRWAVIPRSTCFMRIAFLDEFGGPFTLLYIFFCMVRRTPSLLWLDSICMDMRADRDGQMGLWELFLDASLGALLLRSDCYIHTFFFFYFFITLVSISTPPPSPTPPSPLSAIIMFISLVVPVRSFRTRFPRFPYGCFVFRFR